MSIDEVLARHSDSLLAIPGVVGVAHAEIDGQPVVRVLVVTLTPELRRRVPATLHGYAVQVVETGVIEAQPGDT
jgi:hypothetical protein